IPLHFVAFRGGKMVTLAGFLEAKYVSVRPCRPDHVPPLVGLGFLAIFGRIDLDRLPIYRDSLSRANRNHGLQRLRNSRTARTRAETSETISPVLPTAHLLDDRSPLRAIERHSRNRLLLGLLGTAVAITQRRARQDESADGRLNRFHGRS